MFLRANDDGSIDIVTAGRKMRVLPAPDIDVAKIVPGSQLVLNESLNVVEVLAPDGAGEVVKVKDRLGEDRVIVLGRGDDEHVAYLAGELLADGRCAPATPRCSTRDRSS